MKVAVTGATGFIGRHVLRELAARSIQTIALVRPSQDPPSSMLGAKTMQLDIHAPPAFPFELMGCPDILIHLAWGGLPNYQSTHHFESELPAQYRFLKNLVESGLPRLFVTGTCLEYGMQFGPLSPQMDTRPSNPYGFAKDVLRHQLKYLQAKHPFQLIWARLFYLYGEGQSETSLFSQLKQAVARGDGVFNMSGGEQLRDYLHVNETAKAIVDIALSRRHIELNNICSGRPISIRAMVERWITDNKWSIELNLGYFPYPDYEPMAFWGSDEHGTE